MNFNTLNTLTDNDETKDMTQLRRSFGLQFKIIAPFPFFRYKSASCHSILALLNAAAANFTIGQINEMDSIF